MRGREYIRRNICRGSPVGYLQVFASFFRLRCLYKVVAAVTFDNSETRKRRNLARCKEPGFSRIGKLQFRFGTRKVPDLAILGIGGRLRRGTFHAY
jgi:hypothetical protein